MRFNKTASTSQPWARGVGRNKSHCHGDHRSSPAQSFYNCGPSPPFLTSSSSTIYIYIHAHKYIYTHIFIYIAPMCVCAQSCPTLCDSMDCSPPGSSVHGILQARILEWVAISFSHGIFLTQGLNPCLLHLLHWQVDSLPLVPAMYLCIFPIDVGIF